MPERLTDIYEGPMFAGKTDVLASLANKEVIAHRKPQVYRPEKAIRDEDPEEIRSRDGKVHRAISITHPKQILEQLEDDTTLVIIDEVHFLDQKNEDGVYVIGIVVDELNDRGIKVAAAGLSRDFRQLPIGPMPDILARGRVHHLTSICTNQIDGKRCGEVATETQRFVDEEPAYWNDPVFKVGDKKEGYEAFCIGCHRVQGVPQRKLE